MSRPALVKRRLQMQAGGQQDMFYACWEHACKLLGGTDVPKFSSLIGHDVKDVSEDDGSLEAADCDFCDE